MIQKNSLIFILFMFVFVSFSFSEDLKGKTVITGDLMQIRKSGEKTIVKGNAKIVRGSNTVTSDKMTYYKNNSNVDAEGNVNFSVHDEDGNFLKAVSQEAVYNTDNLSGQLWGGRPVIEYNLKDSTDTVYLFADKIYVHNDFESADAEGNVEIISSSGTIISDNALLDKKSSSLFMHKDVKKPQVNAYRNDKEAEFKADEISLFYNNKTVKMNKNVEGKITMDSLEVKE
ncbi:MAG: LptA/OstA family protein [Endomicrobiaceae bacterium]